MEDIKKAFMPVWPYISKALVVGLLTLASFILNEWHDAVLEIERAVSKMSEVVIRLDEKVERSASDIQDLQDDVKELEKSKLDK